jgi:hypothetical protein
MTERLGDGPIEPKFIELMNEVAKKLDRVFNGEAKGKDRENGFILLTFPFEGHGGRCNYISNANRKDVVIMLKEQLARFEGQPEMSGGHEKCST